MVRRHFTLALVLLAAVAWPAAAQAPVAAKAACQAPEPVCRAADRVFRIASFDPFASAVLIEPGLLVTNRHAVADNQRAQVYRASGAEVLADVVPSAYPGDLVLLRAPAIEAQGPLETAAAGADDALYVIGADVGRNAVRVYAPGRMIVPLAEGKPLARLHHDAFSQPGNSGGAVVDAKGRLVAIVASGGEGRNEAIPASKIETLKSRSGPQHLLESRAIGEAVRKCAEALDAARASRERLGPSHVAFINEHCARSGNRQLFDLAGQVFGRRGLYDESIAMFDRALAQDPNAPNSLVSMSITLHLAGRYADEVKHLRRLIGILPADAEVLRLAVQAGAWGGDEALTEKALTLMDEHHPRLAPMARRFIEANPTPPPRRGRPPVGPPSGPPRR